MEKPQILIIDDDPIMLEMVQEILQTFPCTVLTAPDGEHGLAQLRQATTEAQAVDVVLLDVKLPRFDGFHILQELKSEPLLKQIPVILVTGVNAVQDKARGLQLGAEDYITKPFDPQELLARLNVVLRIRRTERMLRRRNQEMAALNEINRMISTSLELDDVLISALEGLERFIAAEAFLIVLEDEESTDWIIRTAKNPAGTWLEGRVIPPANGRESQSITERRAILSSAVTNDFWFYLLGIGPLDQLYIPLTAHDAPVGLLIVLGKDHTLSRDNLPLFERMAATVSIAVENAQLYGELAAFTEALERSQSQLLQAEKMAAVGRLTASIAHEINNPLQAIQNSLHLAGHPHMDAAGRQRYLDMAQGEVERLVHIVRRMLDFYRPASSTLQALSPNAAVEAALAMTSKRLKQAHIETLTRLAPGLPSIVGSNNQLTQVYLNIIINAVEAMGQGGELRIGSAYHEERGQIVIAFRDNGSGIAPEVREHLFEPFHTTKSTGTGLGLAISYGIIERHGGVIEVESPAEGGATFIVRLPLTTPQRRSDA
ncbi:MAG: response regulator [Chloroflexota bacterium]|nr:response regulator [Chloroflexota bacterium]